jgi:hypothetical protein
MRFTWAWAAVVSVLLPLGAWAQDKPAAADKPAASPAPPVPQGKRVDRVIKLKNPNLLGAFQQILGQFQVRVNTNQELGVIALSGSPEAVAAAEDVVARFDRPAAGHGAAARNLAFAAHLLVGRHQEAAGPGLPAELGPVVEQLRGVFNYKSYELLDTLAIRVAEGRRGSSFVEGSVRWPAGSAVPARTQLRIEEPRITGEDEKGHSIRIPKLTLKVDLPVSNRAEETQYRSTFIETGLDLREGQKVVVGKASFDGTSDALILVLKADVEG